MNPAEEVLRALEEPSESVCDRCGHTFSMEFQDAMYETEDGDYICLKCYEADMDQPAD
jgi:formylmethanofuran dehydrogenase subunit E